jgi:hypothetical protein
MERHFQAERGRRDCRRRGERAAWNNLEPAESGGNFLESLIYTHQEAVSLGGGQEASFLFMHGLPSPKMSLFEQRPLTHDDFNRHLARLAALASPKGGPGVLGGYGPGSWGPSAAIEAFLWGRSYNLEYGYEGEIVIHGHTPTTGYERHYGLLARNDQSLGPQFRDYPAKAHLPFLFSRSPGASLKPFGHESAKSDLPPGRLAAGAEAWFYETDGASGLEAINIDTGAAQGGALTAIGLTEKYLSRGGLLALSCPAGGFDPVGGRQSGSYPKMVKNVIKVNKFGGQALGGLLFGLESQAFLTSGQIGANAEARA